MILISGCLIIDQRCFHAGQSFSVKKQYDYDKKEKSAQPQSGMEF
jgi:hypothetical protein